MSAVIKLPNKITSFLLIPGITIIFWAYPLFVNAPLNPSFTASFISNLANLLTQWHLDIVIAFFLVLINAILLNSLLSKHNLFNAYSYIAGIIYALILSCHPVYLVFHPALILNILILLILNKIFSSYRKNEALLNCYEAGLFAGLATIIYMPGIALIPFVLAANAIIRPFNWKEWVTQILGMATPFYVAAMGLFCWMGWEVFAQIGETISLPLYTNPIIHPFPYLSVICLVIIVLWGIKPIIHELQSRAVRGKKLYSILGWLGAFFTLSIVVFDPSYTYSLPLISIPISVSIAVVLKRENRAWIKGAIFFCIICAIVYSHIVTLQQQF